MDSLPVTANQPHGRTAFGVPTCNEGADLADSGNEEDASVFLGGRLPLLNELALHSSFQQLLKNGFSSLLPHWTQHAFAPVPRERAPWQSFSAIHSKRTILGR